jgi:hypothetical protein
MGSTFIRMSGELSGDAHGGKDERARPTDRARQDFVLADIPCARLSLLIPLRPGQIPHIADA